MRPTHLFLLCASFTLMGCEYLLEPPATKTEITFTGSDTPEVLSKLGEAKAYLVTNKEGDAYITEFRIRWEDFGEDGTDLDLSIAHDAATLADGTYEVFDYDDSTDYTELIASRKLWGLLFVNDDGVFNTISTKSGTITVAQADDGKSVTFDATLKREIVSSMVVDDLGKVEETREEKEPVTLKMTIAFPDATSFQGRL